MDDDSMEYRRNKPQQRLYKPGSGPLRRSTYGLDAKMDHYGSQNSIQDETVSNTGRDHSIPNSRPKKPEQQLYVPRLGDLSSDDRQVKSRNDNSSQFNNKKMSNRQEKQNFNSGSGSYPRSGSRRDRAVENHYKDSGTDSNDVNYNRNYRQVSETRSISPSHIQERNPVNRNRDSRSMESSAARHFTGGGGKPPSGRRNSGGYSSDSSRPKFMGNIDNIPPRFRKKFLEQSGHHSFDSVDQINRHASNQSLQPNYNQSNVYNSNLNWSQTLPSRGRGRLREEGIDSEKFINSYLKNYEVQNSGRSTPSSSCMNIYESSVLDNKQDRDNMMSRSDSQKDCYGSTMKNGLNESSDVSYHNEPSKESQHENDTISQITNSLLDMTNLDWTEEVEKNIKLDDMCDSSTSFSQTFKSSASQEKKQAVAQENKSTVSHENRHGESKRRSRRSNKRSSSRGQRSSEKKERNRRDSNASIQLEPERNRKDSNVSMQHETIFSNLKQRERERRDSHKSNRSSTIGNSRDDLDRWRSLRSYSREQSAEGRIVSQCNSRDTSVNRATSPRDNDGFKIPASKSATWTTANQKKSNGSWASGRTPSVERGRQSPAPSVVSTGGDAGGAGDAAAGGRRGRKGGRRRGRHAEPAHHPLPTTNSSSSTNWREEILESKKHATHERHPETPSQRTRINSTMSDKSVSESSSSHPGLIVLPQSSLTHLQKEQGKGGSKETQKTLYDHQNPSKPIIVQTSPNKIDVRMDRDLAAGTRSGRWREAGAAGAAGEAGEADAARAARHRELLQRVDRADAILQTHALRGPLALAAHWPDVADTRKFLQNALHRLLMSDLKYCQADNIEHHFWKILYYNFIEVLRKSFTQIAPEHKPEIVKLINVIIEEGNVFFESLVQELEKTYKFNIDDYINDHHVLPPKGLGYVGLALISVQKLYVFLGDLARYKEQVNETNNYAKSKYWYTKAQQINPKNGRPYNQLAILAIYARRKLDAVYYYMRSLMSSNPFSSARESLISLFDENRKKYEAAERKRRAAAETTRSTENGDTGHSGHGGCGLRREIWVRPSGHRTTTLRPHNRDEDFASMTSVELNKSFITSYLHVHGKLITKIGMESFHESASLMLRQFRALLARQPLPAPAPRLLQLTALNMFAVETTATHKDASNNGSRTAWLECALGVSLLMFGVMLERCCALLPEPTHAQQHTDALLLLPAIKVWSDWMLCHSSVWNPPPMFNNFEIESENDPWDWLAKLMNILENLDEKSIELEYEPKEGYLPVRLAEDASLGGFTPLMYMEPATAWLRPDPSPSLHIAEHALRTRKLLFFGTEYLVGVEPPVLRLEYPGDAPPRYVSAVQRLQPNHPPLHHLSEDSEDEDNASGAASGPTSLSEDLGGSDEAPDEATRRLLRRKEQLESRKAILEKRRERMQEMLRGGWVSVEVEVRPRWLVPDTNCFIDHLPLLAAVVDHAALPYVLAVPLVVMTELEGLKKCSRVGPSAQAALSWVARAADAARMRLATSRGSLLASCAFTAEREHARATNDDRVLATAVNLQANLATQTESPREEAGDMTKCVKRVREVVLLTDDRNLRVKALAAELPARDLPSFMQWAGLAQDLNPKTLAKEK